MSTAARNTARQDAAKTGDQTDEPTVLVAAVDKTATEPAVPDGAEVAAPSHDSDAVRTAREGLDPKDDPSIPKRHPDGKSPNESPEIALSRVEIPAHNSNEQLGIAAAKRAKSEAGGSTDEPRGRRAPSQHTS